MESNQRTAASTTSRSIPWPLLLVFCLGMISGWLIFWPDSSSSGIGEQHNWTLRFAVAGCLVVMAGLAGAPFRRSGRSMSLAALAGLLTPVALVLIWIGIFGLFVGIE